MFKGLKPIVYNGQEVWPLVEGGKGVAATNHASAGAWAAAGGIGTVSAVNADSYDAEGKIVNDGQCAKGAASLRFTTNDVNDRAQRLWTFQFSKKLSEYGAH